jgi:hypothetical protein
MMYYAGGDCHLKFIFRISDNGSRLKIDPFSSFLSTSTIIKRLAELCSLFCNTFAMAANGHDTVPSSCRCLNIRIKPQPGADTPPYTVSVDSAYAPVFVADEGIIVVRRKV